MPNSSIARGYLLPDTTNPPLEGQELNRFLQQFFVGITGLDGSLVRPWFQAEPPDPPDAGEAWMAFRYTSRPNDTYPYFKHDPTGEGSDELQRHERLDLVMTIYDLGTNGLAEYYAALLRDGLSVPQNLEELTRNNMGFVSCGGPINVPVLVKARWQYRVDLPIAINRQITRVYPVRNVLSAQGILYTDDPDAQYPLTVEETP